MRGGKSATNIEENNESNEESGNDSDRANQKNESTDEDSDMSSELDEKECGIRRGQCLETLMALERQFNNIRELLYLDRILQIEQLLTGVRAGTSNDYLTPLNKLQDEMMTRIQIAGQLKHYRMLNIRNLFEAEELAAKQNFEEEKLLAWDAVEQTILRKIELLNEEKCGVKREMIVEEIEPVVCAQAFIAPSMNVPVTAPVSVAVVASTQPATIPLVPTSIAAATVTAASVVTAPPPPPPPATRTRSSGKTKTITVTGPYIVYNLDEKDILEDWALIRRSLKNTVTVL